MATENKIGTNCIVRKISKILFLLYPICFYTQPIYAQFQALNIGDTVPTDIPFHNIANYPIKNPTISEFKNKLIILDFWSTGCSSCIDAMPKMEELQKHFGDSIQIILVNSWEKEAKIKERISIMKNYDPIKGLSSLPTVNGDTTWRILFPHATVPHHVWINGDGKVIAVTNGYNATKEHIEKVLKGRPINFTIKNDITALGYNPWKEGLFKSGYPTLRPLFHSGFIYYSPGFGGGMATILDSTNTVSNRVWFNSPIKKLFEEAFFGREKIKRTLVKVSDKTAFEYPKDGNGLDTWNKQNLYSYQIQLPFNERINMQVYMQQDLNRFFGMERGILGENEIVDMPCLILIIKKIGLLYSKGAIQYYHQADRSVTYVNMPFASITSGLRIALEDMSKPLAFVDETGFTGNVDMAITGDLHNLENVKRQLQKYGLDIQEGTRKMEVLVIKDKK